MSSRRNKPLFRDTRNKKLGGVCAGLAEYLDVDVTLVRAITASLILLGPPVVAAYAILWLVLDPAPPALPAPPAESAIDLVDTVDHDGGERANGPDEPPRPQLPAD